MTARDTRSGLISAKVTSPSKDDAFNMAREQLVKILQEHGHSLHMQEIGGSNGERDMKDNHHPIINPHHQPSSAHASGLNSLNQGKHGKQKRF